MVYISSKVLLIPISLKISFVFFVHASSFPLYSIVFYDTSFSNCLTFHLQYINDKSLSHFHGSRFGYNVKGLVARGDDKAEQLEENMDVNPLAFENEWASSDGGSG
eukprot:COSAG06_NODE_12558_length_1363_cov_1.401899_1_plen_105_part_10